MRDDHQRHQRQHNRGERRDNSEDIYGYRPGGHDDPLQRGLDRQENRAYPDDDEYAPRRDFGRGRGGYSGEYGGYGGAGGGRAGGYGSGAGMRGEAGGFDRGDVSGNYGSEGDTGGYGGYSGYAGSDAVPRREFRGSGFNQGYGGGGSGYGRGGYHEGAGAQFGGGRDDFDDIYGRGYGEGGFADGVSMDTGPDWARRSRGRGGPVQRTMPKGYARSDERIREDVCEQLSHSGIDVSDVSVTVSQGEVTLEGSVRDRYLKHGIENCADHCLGVKDVHNHLRVTPGTQG